MSLELQGVNDSTCSLDFSSKERRKRLIAELKACSRSKNLQRGKNVHAAAIASGDDSNVYVASMLINMYAKCGCMGVAHGIFHGLNDPDVVCWTALILGYAEVGEGATALDCFWQMRSERCEADSRIYVAAVKSCSDLAVNGDKNAAKRGQKIHLLALTVGYDLDLYVQAALVDMYAKCGRMECARDVFESILYPNVVCWTALIWGYAENGKGWVALSLFSRMRLERCSPNSVTFIAVTKAFLTVKETIPCRAVGRAVHLLISSSGFDSDSRVQSTLMDMYAKVESMSEARKVFEGMEHQDVVCWNALLLGYADNGEISTVFLLFLRMQQEGCAPDARTFVAVLKTCTDLVVKGGNGEGLGKAVHLLAATTGCDMDNFVENTLVDMYAKYGSMKDAQKVFTCMKHPDVVSLNSLMLGYVENGKSEVTLQLYSRMQLEHLEPDAYTFAAVLKACAIVGALELGKEVHAEICSRGYQGNSVLATCLVDFYTKCGSLGEAEQVFLSHDTSKLETWNALMAGYSRHGDTKAVFELFEKVRKSNLQPDSVTFSVVLTACSHAGLVEKARDYFEAMSSVYRIDLHLEHYTCMIDILSRSNKLDESMALLRSMPCSPDAVAWMSVLGACRQWKHLELGKLAFQCFVSLDDKNPGAYVSMANIFGTQER